MQLKKIRELLDIYRAVLDCGKFSRMQIAQTVYLKPTIIEGRWYAEQNRYNKHGVGYDWKTMFYCMFDAYYGISRTKQVLYNLINLIKKIITENQGNNGQQRIINLLYKSYQDLSWETGIKIVEIDILVQNKQKCCNNDLYYILDVKTDTAQQKADVQNNNAVISVVNDCKWFNIDDTQNNSMDLDNLHNNAYILHDQLNLSSR